MTIDRIQIGIRTFVNGVGAHIDINKTGIKYSLDSNMLQPYLDGP